MNKTPNSPNNTKLDDINESFEGIRKAKPISNSNSEKKTDQKIKDNSRGNNGKNK